MDLDIYRTLNPKATEYTFFSTAHGTFSKIDNMVGNKTIHNKFNWVEIIKNKASFPTTVL